MKLKINKLNEEKINFIIEDNRSIIFENTIFYKYMDKIMFDNDKINEMIVHLKILYGEINEVENNFSV
jgi:hypothetical protein